MIDRFSRCMEQFFVSYPKQIAVAVSGGADSMALAFLLKCWCAGKGIDLVALTVDHGLRVESTQEARFVTLTLQKLGIVTHTLVNTLGKPEKAIQAYARQVRYHLLENWCRDNSVYALCVAHHRGDVLETTALRRESGSTYLGLAGMSPVRYCDFGCILRPVLSFEKEDLLRVCKRHTIHFIEDPSNDREDFLRVKMRHALKEKSFKRAIENLQHTSLQRRLRTENLLREDLVLHTSPFPAGYVIFHFSALTLPFDRRFNLLRQCLIWVSCTHVPPRTKKIVIVLKALQKNFTGMTLHGCCLKILRGKLYIFREYKAISAPVCGEKIFDNRFFLTKHYRNNKAYTLGVLGKQGKALLAKRRITVKNMDIPKTLLPILPTVFYGSHVYFILGITLESSRKCAIIGTVKNLFAPAPFN